jgi:hypothetical protein
MLPKSWLSAHEEPFQYLTTLADVNVKGTYYSPGLDGQTTSAAFV